MSDESKKSSVSRPPPAEEPPPKEEKPGNGFPDIKRGMLHTRWETTWPLPKIDEED